MTSSVLKTQHTSLQFSDTAVQQESDIEKIFSKGKLFPIKTGTEAGTDNANFKLLREAAGDYNHRIKLAYGNWVAVDRSIIKPGSVQAGEVFVADNKKMFGRGHHRAFPFVRFTHVDERIGRIAQAAAHYPTKGATEGDPNHALNELYAKKLFIWMSNANKRGGLPFVNGDFNMNDRKLDWAFDYGWTSMADELNAWKDTGHGPIDGFASLDKSKRVKAKKFVVLTDKDLHLFGDHFVCRGTWTIKHLPK